MIQLKASRLCITACRVCQFEKINHKQIKQVPSVFFNAQIMTNISSFGSFLERKREIMCE